MRISIFSLFFLFHVFAFSQTDPVAAHVSTAHFKDISGNIHLVGSDKEGGTLTYTIVRLPSHGDLQDPLNSDAAVAAGGTLSGNQITFVPHSAENSKYIFSGTTFFTYKVSDDSSRESETMTVTVKVFDTYYHTPPLIGSEIPGQSVEDNFGRAVSLSEDGTIMAVGAPQDDDGGGNAGSVMVYQFSGGSWSTIGNQINGASAGDKAGSSVSLSGDGTILAVGLPYNDTNIGQVKIFKYDGSSNWDSIGTITPLNVNSGASKAVSEQFGNDVRLSSDGKTLAVSDIWFDRSGRNDAGRVVVYRYDGTNWNSLGNATALYGESGDNFSWGLSLSANGNIMAIGAHEHDKIEDGSTKNAAGKVIVYKYNGTSWDVFDQVFNPGGAGDLSASTDRFGAAVDLSSNGLILAVGAPYDNPDGTASNRYQGTVNVFYYNGTKYVPLGTELKGDTKFNYFGAQLSLDNEGNTLAVMQPGHGDDNDKGQVKVYNYNIASSTWEQSPASYNFDGEEDDNQSAGSLTESKGQRVFLSGDGSVLAIGADLNNSSGGTDSGHVKVHRLFDVQDIPVADDKTVSFTLYEQQWSSEEIELTGSDTVGDGDIDRGITTSAATNKLIEAGQNFTSTVSVGNKVISKLDGQTALVSAVDSDTQLTLDTDIMISGEAYTIDIVEADLVYIITELNTSKIREGGTEIGAIPHTLTGKKVEYNSNSDVAVNDSFKYIIHDGKASSVPATVSLTIVPDNDPPVASAVADQATDENTAKENIILAGTDVDNDDTNLNFLIYTVPTNGTLVDANNGNSAITVEEKDSGTTDGVEANKLVDSTQDFATTVQPGDFLHNTTDNTYADIKAVDSNTKLSISADIMVSGETYTIKRGTSLSVDTGTAKVTYSPNNTYSGSDTFAFKARDKGLKDEIGTDVENSVDAVSVSITVNNTINDAPVAQNGTISTNEETESGAITLIATDPDDLVSDLTFTITENVSNGKLKDGGTEISTFPHDLTGILKYTPNDNFIGDDTFKFTAKDDGDPIAPVKTSNEAVFTISVADENDPPVADAQSLTTAEETETGTITLVATDVDDDDTTLSYTIKTNAVSGKLKDGGTEISTFPHDITGALTYLPDTDFNGDDTFTFTAKDEDNEESNTATVTITVNEFNDPPTADDQTITDLVEQTPITITLIGSDAETANLTYIVTVLPKEGTLSENGNIISSVPKTIGSTSFLQMGPDFKGGKEGSNSNYLGFGQSSMSSDGTKISFSSYNGTTGKSLVKIFSWDGTTWTQIGSDIIGDDNGDEFGAYNSLSSDGTIIAIGAAKNDAGGTLSGQVKVFKYNGTDWLLVGAVINGDNPGDYLGSVSLSSDGTKLAVGAPNKGGNNGQVVIYNWDGSAWNPLGSEINGASSNEFFGSTVHLSGNGERLAIGARESTNLGGAATAGHVGVYDWNGTDWNLVGAKIEGVNQADGENQSVFLSKDGSTLAVGSGDADTAANKGKKYGKVRVYKYNGTSWDKTGDLDGNAEGNNFGNSVGLSSDGKRLIAGSWLKDKGAISIYDYSGASWTKSGADQLGNVDQDRFGAWVYISDDGKKILSSNNPIVSSANDFYLKAFEIKATLGNKVIYTGTSETPNSDLFKFKTRDEGAKESSDATVSITFLAVNDPPVAQDEDLETDEDVEDLAVTLKATDVDDDDSTLVYTILTETNNGVLKDDTKKIETYPYTLSGNLTFTPEKEWNGDTTFTFKATDDEPSDSNTATIKITVKPVNDPPTADDQDLDTEEDTPLKIILTGSDPDGDLLSYLIESLPTNGILKEGTNTILASELPRLLPANSLTYVPNTDFVGNDSFNFIINTNLLESFSKNNGLKYITKDGVPVTYKKPKGNTYFLIQNETGQPGFSPVEWPDAKTLTESIEGAGMYIILNAEMSALVMDGLNDMGIGKGTSNLYWLGLYQDKTSPDYAEPGREDQNWGGWTWTDGVTLKDRGYFNWRPNEPNNAGAEDYGQINWSQGGEPWNDMHLGGGQSWPLFEFSINDSESSNVAKISINIKTVNDPPVANPQTVTVMEDSIDGSITLTGTDPESQSLTYIVTSLTNSGVLKNDGTPIIDSDLPITLLSSAITYSPNADYNGNDAFTFKVSDAVKESTAAIVSIIVTPVNDPPESDPQTVNTDQETSVDITHVGRDNDLVDTFTAHTQMGKDIQLPTNWGEFIELSADGKTMVIGGWKNNKVKVYGWNGTAWNQLGNDIDGSATGDEFGEFVSIASDGKRIAVGANKHDSSRGQVRAFGWDGTSWDQLGNEMLGSSIGDQSSFRGIHMSGDGNVIAAASFKQGYVDTYKWDGTSWNKTGVISNTKVVSSDTPGQVSLSNSGDRLAIGSVAGAGDKGQVKIFDWDGTNTWNQYAAIDGKAAGEKFGNTLSISRDGKKIAIGVYGAGSARVYDLSGSNFNQVGADINYGNGAAWRAISLSDDGNRIAIPILNQKTGVFDWNGTSWNKLGEDLIKPPASPNLWGESLDMSSDGKTLVIGGHNGFVQVFNILNLNYIITTYPSNGILKEGSKTITKAELPYTLEGTDATYVPNLGFYGEDEYFFKLNDGKSDSTNSLNDKREDSKVKIIIKEYILDLPSSNYKIKTTETCKGSEFGIIDIEVSETSYKITPSGNDIPITYNVLIDGKGLVATIVSPNKTAQIKDLAGGTYKLSFTVQGQPKYLQKFDVVIEDPNPPIAYPIDKIELCDDNVDGEDDNGKVNFDTSLILNKLLTDPISGNIQDKSLFDIEFTYFDETAAAIVTKATLPSPFYSATQSVQVKFTSKVNGSCEGTQTIDFKVNPVPVFERIENTISVCSNLDPVTIGVKSSDSNVYSYTWTRNGTVFPPNIEGVDSSILIGAGGEYVVTATTKDGSNCSKSMTITIKESSIATIAIEDITIKDLRAGPNNSITISLKNLGIGDYEFAIDDVIGPYQDEPVFEKVRPGKHTIYVRDKNQCGTAKIDVWVIGYKKFFTPNGDGYTDTWNIIGITPNNLPKSKIYLFDRYEKFLKELDPLSPGWDGTFNGKPMPQTDYWFRAILEDGREFKGHFSLIRGW